ncbi:TrbC/VirB2 family protein [Rhizobium binae]|uniref:TrbC/VirB2 family protein n=1 Tax=Rhizobium binae TaxID=1138190 RepID=UPI001C82AB7F|nr:TrbC/VirB2 family protein [Rhizobium binae]MBX4967729.1 TrbC/VirB2 family protein [Rhizobium binae]
MKYLKKHLLNKDNLKFVAMIAAMTLLFSTPSAAQDFSGVETFLDAIVNDITGPIGVSVSALAVIAVGFSFMTGRMDWTFAVSIILGIAIVFGGATFVQSITAS